MGSRPGLKQLLRSPECPNCEEMIRLCFRNLSELSR